MLNIYFGELPQEYKEKYIYNTSIFFDNTYLDNWLDDEMSKKIIKNVDKSEVISSNAIKSKALGIIPVTKLSGGTKTLLLIQHDKEHIFNVSKCGDNCAKWLLRLAKESNTDITVSLWHLMNFGEGKFNIRVLNNDTVVTDMSELVMNAGKYI